MPKDSEPAVVQPGGVQQLEARIADLENRVNQLTRVHQFSETQLLDALKAAKPGDELDFGDVSRYLMEAAVFKLSEASGSQAQTAEQREAVLQRISIDLGQHITQISYWWGVRVELDHDAMQALAQGGDAVAALLVAAGVSAFVGAIIAAVINIWAAFDRGNGVIFFVTWTGIHWFTPR